MELFAMLTLLFVLGLLADVQILTGHGSVLSDETDDVEIGSAVAIGISAVRAMALPQLRTFKVPVSRLSEVVVMTQRP
jgi:hypothetical protein